MDHSQSNVQTVYFSFIKVKKFVELLLNTCITCILYGYLSIMTLTNSLRPEIRALFLARAKIILHHAKNNAMIVSYVVAPPTRQVIKIY